MDPTRWGPFQLVTCRDKKVIIVTETTGKRAFGINELIGKVFILYGKAKAIAPDGTEWVLAVNSPVFAMERIVTDSDGRVCIMMEGPPPTLIDIGRMSDVVLDEDVSGGEGPRMSPTRQPRPRQSRLFSKERVDGAPVVPATVVEGRNGAAGSGCEDIKANRFAGSGGMDSVRAFSV